MDKNQNAFETSFHINECKILINDVPGYYANDVGGGEISTDL